MEQAPVIGQRAHECILDIAHHRLPPPDPPVFIPAQYHPRANAAELAPEF